MQVIIGADHVSIGYESTVPSSGETLVLTTLVGTPKR